MANFYWSVRMPRMHSSCVSLIPALFGQGIDIESSLGSCSDGDAYLSSVRGSRKTLVLKVFSSVAFGQAKFCAYMAVKGLQGSIIPVCYGYGYMAEERLWVLVEHIRSPPSRASLSDVKHISRPYRGRITGVKSCTRSRSSINLAIGMVICLATSFGLWTRTLPL
ncbi:hypothetical protein IW262DRAFT_938758 [Armillaria fumosa]|nr:hypothetical protein IW262DRAFT_938758 [Armillaria fumosa]